MGCGASSAKADVVPQESNLLGVLPQDAKLPAEANGNSKMVAAGVNLGLKEASTANGAAIKDANGRDKYILSSNESSLSDRALDAEDKEDAPFSKQKSLDVPGDEQGSTGPSPTELFPRLSNLSGIGGGVPFCTRPTISGGDASIEAEVTKDLERQLKQHQDLLGALPQEDGEQV